MSQSDRNPQSRQSFGRGIKGGITLAKAKSDKALAEFSVTEEA
jgi:hypothetical protein